MSLRCPENGDYIPLIYKIVRILGTSAETCCPVHHSGPASASAAKGEHYAATTPSTALTDLPADHLIDCRFHEAVLCHLPASYLHYRESAQPTRINNHIGRACCRHRCIVCIEAAKSLFPAIKGVRIKQHIVEAITMYQSLTCSPFMA